jgi:putative methionine-R-sulfoxide reductase with GAF domain
MQNKTFEGIKENKLFTWADSEFIGRLKFDQKKLFTCEEGSVIYRINDESELLYLVVEGEVKIKNYQHEKSGSFGSTVIKIKNDFFGEKEIIYRTPRASFAVANCDCVLYGLSINDLPKYLIRKLYYLNNAAFPEQELLTKETKNFLQLSENIKMPGKNLFLRVKAPGKMNYYREVQAPSFGSTPHSEKFTTFGNKINFYGDLKSEFKIWHEYKDKDEAIRDEYSQNHDLPHLKKYSEEKFPLSILEGDLNPEIKKITSAVYKIISSAHKIESVLIESANLLDCEKCELFIADTADNELIKWNSSGKNSIKFKIGLAVTGVSAEKKEIVFSNDVKYDQRFIREYEGAEGIEIKSMLCLPLINKENNLSAVLQFINSYKGEFKEFDKKYLELLSPLILSLIECEMNEDKEEDKFSALRRTAEIINYNLDGSFRSIKTYADLLHRMNLTPEVKQTAETIRAQADCSEEYLLTLAEYAAGNLSYKLEKADMNDTLRNFLKSVAEFADSKNIKLFTKFNAQAPVLIDKKKFRQACFHTISDSSRAMPDGGKIYIKTEIEGGSVKLEFKCSSSGIAEDVKRVMFETFSSKPDDRLGLSIAREIIKKFGGTIEASSNFLDGASVIISLPVFEELID